MARIRTFIAVDISSTVKDRVTALQEKLAGELNGVRWSPRENFHLTLLFLGEVDRLDIVPICNVVRTRSKKHSAFACEFAGLGGFPNVRRPKVLWLGITEGAEELKDLHDDLEEGLLELGNYRREDRGYTPHLTLGRTTSELAEEFATVLSRHADWQGGASNVGEVLVMSSEMRREGPEYSIIGRGPLAK